MTNLVYIIAAYGITLTALAGYALVVWSHLRVAEREAVSVLRPPKSAEEGHYGL